MNWRSIAAIVQKDATLFFRNRFFAVITVLGLVMGIVVYFIMPSTLEETLELGVYSPSLPPGFEELYEGEIGIQLLAAESEEALRENILEGEYSAGLVLPPDLVEKLSQGEAPDIKVYIASDQVGDMEAIVGVLIAELTQKLGGQSIEVDWQQEVLGRDMAGAQIPLRDRIRSLLVVVLLMAEVFGLASLMSEEAENRTAIALLATPMTVRDLFAAKGIFGTVLAFGQAAFFLAVVRGLDNQPGVILVGLLLGSTLAAAIGFLAASLGKDFLSVAMWGALIMILLSVPGIAVMTPGVVSGWIKVIPSYYLVDTVSQASNFGAGWGNVWQNLLILLGFSAALFAVGILAFRRKLR